VTEQLIHKSVDPFLPLYETIRKWKNGFLHEELSLLLADLGNDPKYSERVSRIRTLLADP